ncbi:hypothetical protein Vretimale_1264 [Volvox reticuliferus]|uniref:EamA domain-containing protein n=1 Tax=Volvox reticuliferus TaxID=1737510 RepID=A0A8J4CH38_9CHLO|nr:hypothetical protein Vretifemale_10698 [Volvox reticuliferus]GIL95230.1 hypothetical protein Vretimale_1264 [Volvox reticuliferus]
MNLLRAYWQCGPLVIGTAAFAFSFTALTIKFIGASVPPFETVSASGLFCLVALTGLLLRNRLPLLPKGNFLNISVTNLSESTSSSGLPSHSSTACVTFLTLLRSVFGSVATSAFILSLQLLSLKDAVTLFFTSPIIALLLDWLLMGHSPGCCGATATAFTLAGALLVTQPPFLFGAHSQAHQGTDSANSTAGIPRDGSGSGNGLSSLGVVLALVAAAANASGFLTISLLRGLQHPLVLTWWYNLVLAAMTAVPLVYRWPQAPVLPSRREVPLLLAVGSTQLAAQLCLNRGFQLESAGRGAAINVLQVLFSFILDVVVLGDKPSRLSVGGSSLVAAGVLFVALSSDRRVVPTGGHERSGADAVDARNPKPSARRESGAEHRVFVDAGGSEAVARVKTLVKDPRVAEVTITEPLLGEASS